MSDKIIKEIIHGRVHVQIGKNGLNEGVINQIREQFENNKYLKIRFLDMHYFDSMKHAAEELTKRTRSKAIDIRGKTCVLQRQSQDK